MFKEIVELFEKLTSPTVVQSVLLRRSSIPTDIVDILFIAKKLSNDPDKYYKIVEGNDVTMILYTGLYDEKNTVILEDVILKDGKPMLYLVLDSDIIMEGPSEAIISAILAISFAVTCFYKAKCSMFLYKENSTIEKVFDQSTLVLFVTLCLATFRKSDKLYELMLTSICQIKGYYDTTKEDLDNYVNIIGKCGIEFLLDNSGMGGRDE